MQISTLSRRLKLLESKNDTGEVIRVVLSDGSVVTIAQSQILDFGANAVYSEHSQERQIVLNTASFVEESGHLFEALRCILLPLA